MNFWLLELLEQIFGNLGVFGIGDTAGISDEQLQGLLLVSGHVHDGQ